MLTGSAVGRQSWVVQVVPVHAAFKASGKVCTPVSTQCFASLQRVFTNCKLPLRHQNRKKKEYLMEISVVPEFGKVILFYF